MAAVRPAGTPFHVLTGGLAILFLFPLAWCVFASVSPADEHPPNNNSDPP